MICDHHSSYCLLLEILFFTKITITNWDFLREMPCNSFVYHARLLHVSSIFICYWYFSCFALKTVHIGLDVDRIYMCVCDCSQQNVDQFTSLQTRVWHLVEMPPSQCQQFHGRSDDSANFNFVIEFHCLVDVEGFSVKFVFCSGISSTDSFTFMFYRQ